MNLDIILCDYGVQFYYLLEFIHYFIYLFRLLERSIAKLHKTTNVYQGIVKIGERHELTGD